jgi:hypothetical protein
VHSVRLLAPVFAAAFAIASIGSCEAMDGAAWYEICLRGAHSTWKETKEWPIEKRLEYRACRIEAINVWCEQEFGGADIKTFVENLQAQGWKLEQVTALLDEKLGKDCPTGWNMPFGGPYVFAAQELEKGGGPGVLERWLPAGPMLARAFRARFPRCTMQRKSIGLVVDKKRCLEDELKGMEEMDNFKQ